MNGEWDVIVVGAGPTGLTACHLLARMGVRTLLIERNASTVQQPRAVSIDDEALRTMQAAGLVDDVLAIIAQDYGFATFDPQGRQLYQVRPATREFGYPRRNAFVQPIFEATLRAALDRHDRIDTAFSTECVGIIETESGVSVDVADAQGQRRTLNAKYLIGTDGGKSFVRGVIGAKMEGSTYDQRWLIVDLEGTRDRMRESRVYSDPVRPAVNIPGPDGRRRFEFMLHPDEDADKVTDEVHIRTLIAGFGPDRDAHIVRRQVYIFHARVADRWHTRRIFLAGDAAHLTPPFAGQGVNSAFRDIHNLTWKMAAVVQGLLGPAVLLTYQEERAPHARALIDLAVSNGRMFMAQPGLRHKLMHLGYRLSTLLPSVRNYYAQMKNKPMAAYHSRCLLPNPDSTQVGRMVVQPPLETIDRRVHRMDDLIGIGFALLVIGVDSQQDAVNLARADWGLAELCTLAIVPWNYNLDRTVWTEHAARDLTDAFSAGTRSRVLLVRPDRYVAMDEPFTGDATALAARVREWVRSTWH